jgi:hypothetical protein
VIVAPPGEGGFTAVGDGSEGPPDMAGGPAHFVDGMVDDIVVDP